MHSIGYFLDTASFLNVALELARWSRAMVNIFAEFIKVRRGMTK